MVRFYGKIGYGTAVETEPGVWEDVIEEKSAFGDVLRNTRRLEGGDKVNADISISNSFSIVADAYATGHIQNMKYVLWLGQYWIASDVEVQHPRLIIRPGGVYNGPKAPAP